MTLRIGLVGYGSAGRGIHGRLIREAGHRVVAAVTRQRGAELAADWPGAVALPDVEALLARAGELDLVVVASPSGDHPEHVTAALATGVAVLCDKPLAPDAAGARRLAEAGDRAGGRLTVFHNRRWDPEQLTLRALLAAGDLGAVHRFERRWERWRPVPQQRWKENDPHAGGLLLDLGAHLVDSAVQLFGPVTQVTAELRRLTTPAVDDVFLALRHAPGPDGVAVVSHLQAGSLVGAPGPRTRVLGSRGAYLVTRFEGEASPFAALDPGEGHEGWLVHGDHAVPVPRAPGGHADVYRAVAAWLRGEAPVPVDPWDAVRTAEVLDAAVRSDAERRVVELVPGD